MSEIRVNTIKSENGESNVSFPKGINVTGVVTATSFTGTVATATNAEGLTGSPDITITNLTGVGGTFSGDLNVSGTLTYEDVTNIDAIGVVTARSGVEVTGIITARSGTAVTFTGGLDLSNSRETVSTASTSHYITDKSVTLELDCLNGTVFTHDLDNGNVGVVSITNFPAEKNSFHTVTVLFTQTGSTPTGGVGNTMVAAAPSQYPGGIGTHITLTPRGVTGFATDARVGTATTIVLSGTAGDIDVVSFGIHYNGGTNTDASSYITLASKSGDFRVGGIGQ